MYRHPVWGEKHHAPRRTEAQEMPRKRVTKHGSSGHVYVPKKWIGQTVTVVLEGGEPVTSRKKAGREK